MKMKAIGSRRLVHSLLGGMGLLILSAGLARASDGRDSGRQIAITLNPGETYVIKDLSAGATPAVHVMDNPNALIVNSEKPGELALSGTAAGEKVTYKVDVGAGTSSDRHALVASMEPAMATRDSHRSTGEAAVTAAA